MGYLAILLGVCILFASARPSFGAGADGGFSVASLTTKQGSAFEQKDVVFIQQYYNTAPQNFVDDMLRKEKGLPAGVAASIVRGKPLPKDLIPFVMNEPRSVAGNLGPPPRGLARKVLGTRFLLLDTRMVVQDMIYLPTLTARERRK